MNIIGLIFAAALGGMLRFLIEYRWPPIGSSAFPRATLAANVIGSFILGLVVHAPHDVRLVLGVGLCGALTTFSGVSLQIHRRIKAGAWSSATVYFLVMITAGLVAAMVGIDLSSRIF
jgi:CrcB protein